MRLVLLALASALAAAEPVVPDLAASAPVVDASTCRLEFEVRGVDVDGQAKTVRVRVERHAGAWQPAAAQVDGFRTVTVAADRIELDAGLRGALTLTLRPPKPKDQPQPADVQATVRFAGTLKPAPKVESRCAAPPVAPPAQGWRFLPLADGALAEIEGKDLAGAVLPVAAPGRFTLGAADGDGIRFRFDTGIKRVNWTNARWSVLELGAARDWSAHAGLGVVLRTAKPRDDVGVTLALRDASGAWYYHPWSCDLVAAQNERLVRFADFAPAEHIRPTGGGQPPEALLLDPAKVTALAIGVIDHRGVGVTEFTLAALAPTGAPEPLAPVAVRLGGLLDWNGTTMVPAGLFGAFNVPKEAFARFRLTMDKTIHHDGLNGDLKGSEPGVTQVVNTVGDRIRPSPRLTEPKWEERTAAMAKRFAATGAKTGQRVIAEYWNEPYLNWANRNRAGFVPGLYDLSKAREGGPVHIRHDGAEVPHLRWTRDYDKLPWAWCSRKDWRRGVDAEGRQWSSHAVPYGNQKGMEALYGGPYRPEWHPPEHVKDGERYTVTVKERGKPDRQVELTATTPWHIYDETQFTFWSGTGMLKLYVDPLTVFARTLKQEAPAAIMLAGWQHRPLEDHGAAWHLVYKPTIDAVAPLLDGVTDHDYGGDPTRMLANAHVVTAYGMTAHKRWLTSWNTECASAADPQAAPEGAAPGASADRAKARWIARKIVSGIAEAPDKLRAFAHFGNGATYDRTGGWMSDLGEGLTLTLLKGLRGRLLAVDAGPGVYACASIDGTDPAHPRPADLPGAHELVIALCSNSPAPRRIDLAGLTTAGAQWDKAELRRIVWTDGVGSIVAEPLKIADGAAAVTLAARELAVVAVPVTTAPAAEAPAAVVRKEGFAPAILSEVTPAQPLRTTVALPAADVAAAKRAWVTIGLQYVAEGEGELRIGSSTVPLPRVVAAMDSPRLLRLPVDATALAAETVVEARAAAGHAGYRVTSLGITVER